MSTAQNRGLNQGENSICTANVVGVDSEIIPIKCRKALKGKYVILQRISGAILYEALSFKEIEVYGKGVFMFILSFTNLSSTRIIIHNNDRHYIFRINVHLFTEDVNGEWGSWSSWSQCSSTCGEGNQNRTRKCDNPMPRGVGLFCHSDSTEYSRCELSSCPGAKHFFPDIMQNFVRILFLFLITLT